MKRQDNGKYPPALPIVQTIWSKLCDLTSEKYTQTLQQQVARLKKLATADSPRRNSAKKVPPRQYDPVNNTVWFGNEAIDALLMDSPLQYGHCVIRGRYPFLWPRPDRSQGIQGSEQIDLSHESDPDKTEAKEIPQLVVGFPRAAEMEVLRDVMHGERDCRATKAAHYLFPEGPQGMYDLEVGDTREIFVYMNSQKRGDGTHWLCFLLTVSCDHPPSDTVSPVPSISAAM